MLIVFSFGAVCPQGYGLAYTVKDDYVIVNISNFMADPDTGGSGFGGVGATESGSDVSTDSLLFADALENALLDLQSLFK